MPIYTKKGDAGETTLWGGQWTKKDSPMVELIGTVDETQAAIGLARAYATDATIDAILDDVQNDLYRLNAELAEASHKTFTPLHKEDIAKLEKIIDEREPLLASSDIPLHKFLRPGKPPAAAALNLARTVCRRAERLLVAVQRHQQQRTELLQYLNRLSDCLFQLMREVIARG